MEDHHSGGCQCGAIRFQVKGDVSNASLCHCRMCQKAFGNWGAALVSVFLTQVRWTRGEPAIFRSSSVVDRGFCAQCGTPLYMREDGDDKIDLAVGAFDQPSAIGPPYENIGMESAVSWIGSMNALPQRFTTETRPMDELARLKTYQHPDHDTEQWPASKK